jgi:hypothetical protein
MVRGEHDQHHAGNPAPPASRAMAARNECFDHSWPPLRPNSDLSKSASVKGITRLTARVGRVENAQGDPHYQYECRSQPVYRSDHAQDPSGTRVRRTGTFRLLVRLDCAGQGATRRRCRHRRTHPRPRGTLLDDARLKGVSRFPPLSRQLSESIREHAQRGER